MIRHVLAPKWREKIGDEFQKPYMADVFVFLRKQPEYFPSKENIFKAFQIKDFDNIRVVILGQDPYHTPGYANGLAFAVNNDVVVKPPSLFNIFKEVERNVGGYIDRSKSDLLGWVEQGVFLLNTVLTVEPGRPFSHNGIGWQNFTLAAINALASREDPLVFMLWGVHARGYAKIVPGRHLVLESTHPSPLGVNSGPETSRFTGCRHFEKANQFFEKNGTPTIDWRST